MIDQTLVGFLMIGLMLALLFSGMAIAFALAVSGVVGLALVRPWPAVDFLLGTFPYSASANLAYITLPLFLFMGYMAFAAGVADRAFDLARAWLGVIWRCWQDDIAYQPDRHNALQALTAA